MHGLTRKRFSRSGTERCTLQSIDELTQGEWSRVGAAATALIAQLIVPHARRCAPKGKIKEDPQLIGAIGAATV